MKEKIRILLFALACAVISLGALIGVQFLGGASAWLIACAALLETALGALLFAGREARERAKDGQTGKKNRKGKTASANTETDKKTSGTAAARRKKSAKASDGRSGAGERGGSSDSSAEQNGGASFAARVFARPRLADCLYTALLTAAALPSAFFLRLLSDKLLSLAGAASIIPLSYTSGPFAAVLIFLLILPVLSEVIARHLTQDRLRALFPVGVYFLEGLFFVLVCPAVNRILPAFLCGAALARIYEKTRSYLLPYLSSLFIWGASLSYQYLLSYGFDSGASMTFRSIFSFGLIALSAFALLLPPAEFSAAKRKPKFFEVFAALLIAVILLALGVLLAASRGK